MSGALRLLVSTFRRWKSPAGINPQGDYGAHPTVRKIFITLAALLTLVILGLPSFAAEPPTTPAPTAQLNLTSLLIPATAATNPRSNMADTTEIARLFAPGNAALICPNHPPGFCCSGPPLCRCTRGPCL
jgi:hypothetical protein